METSELIKMEYFGELLCHSCLSSDRHLISLGEFEDIYYSICNYTNTKSEILLCWECIALLKKVKYFKEMVLKAQKIINYHFYKESPPKSLSKLSISNTESPTFLFSFQPIELEKENKHTNVDIKEELEEINSDIQDFGFDNHDFDYEQFDEVKDEAVQETIIKQLEQKEMKRLKGLSKRRKRYKITYHLCDGKIVKRIPIDANDLQSWIEKEQNSAYMQSLTHKCLRCLIPLKKYETLSSHDRLNHKKTLQNRYACDVCQRYLPSKSKLSNHITRHYFKKVCKVCNYECYSKYNMSRHVKSHEKTVSCLKCSVTYSNVNEFYKHYRSLHRKFTCDYCNKTVYRKKTIERHIKIHHSIHHCSSCNITFKRYNHFYRHILTKHTTDRSESAFCAVCDIQFDNRMLYKRHVMKHKAHASERQESRKKDNSEKPKCVKCLLCPKTYARESNMMNHYRLEHMRRSNYYCEKCDKYFLNKTRITDHRRSKHEGFVMAKNKLCNICGRGFSTNRILTNHIRTHTGERPFHCTYCDAKFAQQIALKTHIKCIHLKLKKKS